MKKEKKIISHTDSFYIKVTVQVIHKNNKACVLDIQVTPR